MSLGFASGWAFRILIRVSRETKASVCPGEQHDRQSCCLTLSHCCAGNFCNSGFGADVRSPQNAAESAPWDKKFDQEPWTQDVTIGYFVVCFETDSGIKNDWSKTCVALVRG